MPGFSQKSIIETLKKRPGHILVIPTGKRLYALTKDAEGNDMLLSIDAEEKKFTEMTEEEVNQFIVNKLQH